MSESINTPSGCFPSAANDPDDPVRCLQRQPKSDILQFDHILVKTGNFIRGRNTSLWQISLRPPELDGSIYVRMNNAAVRPKETASKKRELQRALLPILIALLISAHRIGAAAFTGGLYAGIQYGAEALQPHGNMTGKLSLCGGFRSRKEKQ